MTWNILNGGGDRLPSIIEVINEQRPDILTLQELRGFNPRRENSRLENFAAAVGMTPHLARSGFGQPVAVFLRPPLRIDARSSVTWRLHHAAAVVRTGPLTVVSTHLNPHNPHRRMREARWLAARYAGDHLLLAGDLNGLDPHTDHAESLAALPSLYRRRHLRGDGSTDTRAIAALEAAGLTDLSRTAGSGDLRTVPTEGLRGKEFASTRLDYVFAGRAVAPHAHNLEVIRDDLTAHASDHYPVRVDLDL
ncbi:endonuclease/exonuclease/phosphatase family protein [Actinoplanes sp. GCM10030250]|uniref:endonuclease/exonuclease/phosphatase family protein n=1 Tax=Actinoplanes sp. GCM10030250 TaxID=3273376 RepID=UPI003622FBD7